MGNTSDVATAPRWAPWLNLVLPGGGLIVCGAIWSGLLVGLVVVVCANLALAATLIFPDDFSANMRALVIGVAGGTYVGAQLRLAGWLRRRQEADRVCARRERLARAAEATEQGDVVTAVQTLDALAREWPQDLLIAFRLAEALAGAGHYHAARAALDRVRRLDRHGVYRQAVREREQQLDMTRMQSGPLRGDEHADPG